MAYIFDPIRNTFIDDKDKSLGNKFALNDDEFQKLLDIPGVFRASDAPPPPVRPDVQEIEAINRFMRDNPIEKAEGGRINLQEGTDILIPKYPDLRMFPATPNKVQAKAKAKVIDKFKNDLKKFILKQIKDFKKTSLPNEKFQLVENHIHRAMGYDESKGNKPSRSVVKYVREAISELPKDGSWELNKTGKGIFAEATTRNNPVPTEIKNQVKSFFRKNYKTKTITQMATELSGKQPGNPLNTNVKSLFTRFKDFLIEKNIIKKKDLVKGYGGSKFGKSLPPKAFSKYRSQVFDLANLLGVDKDPKYFVTRGTNKGKFSYAKFDNELLKFLNYNLIKGSLSPDFPVEMLPSLEHTMGIGPGTIVGQGDALRKVELQTKQYNFDARKGVSARSKIFRDVQTYLKTAQKTYEAGDFNEAKKSLETVNKLYNLVSERFSLNRKDLPRYVVDKKGIREVNVKEVLKPETVQKSFFNFFKKVANQAGDKTLKQIEKVQPSVAKVIDLFKKGKDTLAKDYIKIRMPNVKGGELLSFAGYGPMPIVELGDKVMQVAKAVKPVAKGLGTATLAVDPVFAALDFSKAAGEGVSGGQAGSYMVQSFFQDLMNLPRVLEDLAYTATEKGTFKNFGEKENRIFDYKPKTFADDFLRNIVEQTPKEVLEARKAIIDFDTQILPGMTMVDDMDLPSSKLEIDEARNKFMDEKGVDLSVLDNLEEDKPKLPPIIESLVAPDQTLNQFLADGGRVGFSGGGAAGADEDFAKELEYYLLNPDAELPKMKTYREDLNPISHINDMLDPRNIPYYADIIARAGVRIGEFGARVIPALGKLTSDLIQKPAFTVSKTGSNYVQDYSEVTPSNIKGTGIFSEFLENITPTSLEKKIGLDKLIKQEEQKQKDRGSTAAPKVLAETVGLGMEFTAPIFPGIKLLKAFAKAKNLPKDKVTEQLLQKEIDKVLAEKGMDRREFLQATGASATVVLAKMLGLSDVAPKATKVVRTVKETVPTSSAGVPPYFFKLVEKIKKNGKPFEAEFDARVENNLSYGGYELRENLSTGQINISKTQEGGFGDYDGIVSEESITYTPGEPVMGKDGKYYVTPDEYEEFTARPDGDGKMKDVEDGLDSVEDIIELLGPNQLKMSELEAAGYNVNAFPENIKQLLINDIKKVD